MKEKLRQFMMGRYGIDQLGQFLNIATLVLLVIGMFVPIVGILAWAALIYTYYRILSRNTEKRQAENTWYLQLRQRIVRWFTTRRQRFSQRNTYRYLRCPSCKQDLRVPKGQGEINVTCPKCHTQFTGKS